MITSGHLLIACVWGLCVGFVVGAILGQWAERARSNRSADNE